MPTPIPTKMSQFENITSLSTASYIIGLDVNGGELKNIRISGSAAGFELARKRWILNPPVTSSADTRGSDGAESYSNDGKYWIKSGSVWVQMLGSGSASSATGSSGISSSYQLSNGGGYAFNNTNLVTFGHVTSSKLVVYDDSFIGSNANNNHFITGSVYMSGSYADFKYSVIYGKLLTISSDASAGKFIAMSNGTLSDPAFTWLLDTDSGLYRIGPNHIGFVAGANLFGTLSSTGGFRITGSLSGSATYAANSNTSSYALYAKSNNVYNVKDFGAVGDGSTNDTNAILLAISSSQAARIGTVYFPDGTYMITGSLSLVSDPQCDIALVGNGSNVSVIKQTANVNAVEFNMDNGGTGDQIYQVAIKGLGFKCSGAVSSSIYVTYGTTAVSAHENISVDINDVHILSDNSNYWSKGIVLETAWNFRISNSMVVGRPLGGFYQGTGLELRRMCVNGSINQSQFNFWNTGIFMNTVDYTSTGQNTEGLFLNQIYMVPVVYGIYAKGNKSYFTAPFNSYDWANRPIAGRIVLLTLNGSHIDSRNSGSALLLENVQGHYISNNFLISDNTGSVIYGDNAHEGTFIGNTLFNAGSAPSIYIGGYSGSANIITGNVFRGGSTHVLLESSSIYNKVYGNVLSDALSITVTDSGTNNLVGSTGN